MNDSTADTTPDGTRIAPESRIGGAQSIGRESSPEKFYTPSQSTRTSPSKSDGKGSSSSDSDKYISAPEGDNDHLQIQKIGPFSGPTSTFDGNVESRQHRDPNASPTPVREAVASDCALRDDDHSESEAQESYETTALPSTEGTESKMDESEMKDDGITNEAETAVGLSEGHHRIQHGDQRSAIGVKMKSEYDESELQDADTVNEPESVHDPSEGSVDFQKGNGEALTKIGSSTILAAQHTRDNDKSVLTAAEYLDVLENEMEKLVSSSDMTPTISGDETFLQQQTAASPVVSTVTESSLDPAVHKVGIESSAIGIRRPFDPTKSKKTKLEAARQSAAKHEAIRFTKMTNMSRVQIPEIPSLFKRPDHDTSQRVSMNGQTRAESAELNTSTPIPDLPTTQPSVEGNPLQGTESTARAEATIALQTTPSNLSALAAEFIPTSMYPTIHDPQPH